MMATTSILERNFILAMQYLTSLMYVDISYPFIFHHLSLHDLNILT